MWRLLSASFLLFLIGCTHQIRPQVVSGYSGVSQINFNAVQVIAPDRFQSIVLHKLKKTSGLGYGAHSFDVQIGEPMAESVYSNILSIAPGSRMVASDDGKGSGLTLTLNNVSAEFYYKDGRAFWSSIALGMFAYWVKAEVDSNVTLDARIDGAGRSDTVRVIGRGSKVVSYGGLGPSDVEDTISIAMDDAAKQVAKITSERLAQSKLSKQ